LPATQAYVDAIHKIVDNSENPDDQETTKILRALPVSGTITVDAIASDQTPRDIGFYWSCRRACNAGVSAKSLPLARSGSASRKPLSRPSK